MGGQYVVVGGMVEGAREIGLKLTPVLRSAFEGRKTVARAFPGLLVIS
jgi:hypothetical protein